MAVAELSKPLTDEKITDEMLLHLPNDFGSKWEFVDGRLQEVPTTGKHDQIVIWLGRLIGPHADDYGILTASQAGYRMVSGNLRVPDFAFTRYDRFPNSEVPDGFIEFAPDLAVEIISLSEEPHDMARKVGEYFASGAKQVWHMFPETQTVIVFHTLFETILYSPTRNWTSETLSPASAAASRICLGSRNYKRQANRRRIKTLLLSVAANARSGDGIGSVGFQLIPFGRQKRGEMSAGPRPSCFDDTAIMGV